MLDRFFDLTENRTDARTEVLAGCTTFLTMSYIIVVQPLVLSGGLFGMDTGMDFGAVMTATCLSAALATVIMALVARYPIAQAPGMGENFFFVLSVIPAAAAGFSRPWEAALGVVVVSGFLFVLLSLAGFREKLINAISPNMKNAMAVGIGLFIAFIGIQNAGLVVASPGTLVQLNPKIYRIDILLFFATLILTSVLHVRGVRRSILIGIVLATVAAIFLKLLADSFPGLAENEIFSGSMLLSRFELAQGVVSSPPSLAPTFLRMDILAALTAQMLPYVVILLFMDVFDTIGTLVGVSEQAGFIKDNRLPRANRALLSDATGTLVGGFLGTSTVTSFIESAAGVEQGGRTGLTGITVAALFLLSLFFFPVVKMVASYPCVTALALVVVGAMMMQNVARIDWKDHSESIPAFLMILGIPLAYSISEGLALGFITYPIIKLFSGKGREVSRLMYAVSVLLVFYFAVFRSI